MSPKSERKSENGEKIRVELKNGKAMKGRKKGILIDRNISMKRL